MELCWTIYLTLEAEWFHCPLWRHRMLRFLTRHTNMNSSVPWTKCWCSVLLEENMSSHTVKRVCTLVKWQVAFSCIRIWLQPWDNTTAPLHIRKSSLNEKYVAGSHEEHTLYSCVRVGMKNFGKRRPGANSHKNSSRQQFALCPYLKRSKEREWWWISCESNDFFF